MEPARISNIFSVAGCALLLEQKAGIDYIAADGDFLY